MLPTTVQLHDIEDVEGFVCATVERSGIQAPEHEREELVADGICILYSLAERFEPRRAGYGQAGRFSGYAAQFLPRRLGDAWHARHPEHARVEGSDGKRRWVYRETPISLEQYLSPSGKEGELGTEDGDIQNGSQELRIQPPSQQAPVPLPT